MSEWLYQHFNLGVVIFTVANLGVMGLKLSLAPTAPFFRNNNGLKGNRL